MVFASSLYQTSSWSDKWRSKKPPELCPCNKRTPNACDLLIFLIPFLLIILALVHLSRYPHLDFFFLPFNFSFPLSAAACTWSFTDPFPNCPEFWRKTQEMNEILILSLPLQPHPRNLKGTWTPFKMRTCWYLLCIWNISPYILARLNVI